MTNDIKYLLLVKFVISFFGCSYRSSRFIFARAQQSSLRLIYNITPRQHSRRFTRAHPPPSNILPGRTNLIVGRPSYQTLFLFPTCCLFFCCRLVVMQGHVHLCAAVSYERGHTGGKRLSSVSDKKWPTQACTRSNTEQL